MTEIIVLTEAARKVLRSNLFRRINELEESDPEGPELAELHKIYSDVVGR